MAIGKIMRAAAAAATNGDSAPAGGGDAPSGGTPSGDAAEGAQTDRTPPRDRPVTAQAGESARKGARSVEKGKQENADATRAQTPGERRAAREEAPPQVEDDNALANQAGEQGGRVEPQRRPEDDPNREDGASLVESAAAQARSQARDGKVDREAFRATIDGRPTEDGEERDALNATSLAALSEELHQESDDLGEGAAELVDRAKEDPNSLTPDEQAAALAQLYMRQGLLETEDEALDALETEESPEGHDDVARGVDSVDSDGVLDGNNTEVSGLDQEDIDARRAEIEEEQAQTQADIDAVIASISDDDAAAIATLGEAGGTATIVDENGEEIDVPVDGQVVERIAEDRAAYLEAGGPVATDSEAATEGGGDAGPDGTGGPDGSGAPDGTGGEAPAPLTDEQLLDAAAADGIIDPNARGQFSFNEAGELTYAAQPGDGYWQVAEHVAPPAGQDFATHWQNTWTENSLRNHGVPDEQFVGVGQQVVIPGYTRDQFAEAYTPVVDPASETEGGGATDGTEGAAPVNDLPENPSDIEVVEAAGPTLSGGPILVIGDATVEVPPDDFVFDGVPTITYTAEVPVNSAEYGEYTATVRRTGLPGDGPFTYEVVAATPAAGSPETDEAAGDTGDQGAGDEGAGTEGTSADAAGAEDAAATAAGPSEELVAQDPDNDGFVDVNGHDVFIYGGDVSTTHGGGANIYSNGVQVAHVFDDGRVELPEGSTDADVQAFLSQQLLAGDADGDGQTDFAYVDTDGQAVAVEDPEHVEALNILLDYYADPTGDGAGGEEGDEQQ